MPWRWRCAPKYWSSKGVLVRKLAHITPRGLIWLTAALMPIQSLPAAKCGCTSKSASGSDCERVEVRTSTGNGDCCRRQRKHSCCDAKTSRPSSCCSAKQSTASNSCECGISCACSKTGQPKPATPPSQNRTSDKIAGESVPATSLATPIIPLATQRHESATCKLGSLGSLDCCVSRCRFTL